MKEESQNEVAIKDAKKKRKKKIIGSIIILCAIIIALCPVLFGIYSCAPHISGDFIFEFQNGYGGGKVCITGISKKGQKKEVLIIPKKIRGQKVVGLFKRTITEWDNPAIELKSEKLIALYAWNGIGTEALIGNCPNFKKAFILNVTKDDYISYNLVRGVKTYIYSEVYFAIRESVPPYPANVTYYYNYEGAENYGCYWLDNLEDGEKITYIPAPPVREGYKFAGWYHEPECEKEWNFETDTVEASDEEAYEDETSFIENRLYAKWLRT